MTQLELNPEEELSADDRGDDTQLRFHYQAQRVAVQALSLIMPEPDFALVYCELHEDALIKHFDRTYTAYQVKSKERSQPKFRATEKTVLKAVRNFARLHRRFGSRMRRFVLASNHPFAADKDKNDLRFLIGEANATTSEALREFMQSFDAKYTGYTQAEIVGVLAKLEIRDDEPDFNSALTAVAEKLRKLPDLHTADDQAIWACARALVAKVEACSRKQVKETNEDEEQEEQTFVKSAINNKLLTPSIVRNTLQSALGMPLGTMYRNIAIQSLPSDMLSEVKSAFAATGHTLLATKRSLADGTKFDRPELAKLTAEASSKPYLVVGEPGSGKSALLADLCQKLRESGKHVVVIKCEDVPKRVQDQLTLAEHLGLPYGAAQCIKGVAETEPVVLLVDQLDAIGALWDTQTSRMQAVLTLVHMTKSLPNVQLVMSCREFDAKFDVRISSFDAQEIRLELPSPEQINQVLSSHSLDCSKWPDDVVAVLRNPQHLDIFVDLLKDSADQVETVRTYMDLLGLLWSKRVTSEDSKVLSKICVSINERKQLFVPVADFYLDRKAIERLSGAGILKFINAGNNIGFAHQTLFEYCLARTFVQSDKSFGNYVIEQQHSLHCRPLIWSCLHYLRNCDLAKYEQEITELLNRSDLRDHIKSLLVEFLAQVRNLTSAEKSLVLPRLRTGVLTDLDVLALCKNGEWLDVLLPTYLPILMVNSKTQELAMRILAEGCRLRESTVVGLLKTHWFHVPELDKFSITVLKEIKSWNAELCNATIIIISRNNFSHTFIEYLILDISKSDPAMAPRVVAKWLEQQYSQACLKPKSSFTPPADVTENERYFWIYKAMQDDPRLKEIVEIIDGRHRYALPDIAKSAPTAFVEAVWPVFRAMIEEVSKEKDDIRRIYLSDLARWTGQKRDKLLKEKYSLAAIFAQIMPEFAAANPERFEQFVAENAASQSLLTHRLLCWGLAGIACDKPDLVVNYLRDDERRLMIGSTYDPHSESIELIQVIAPLVNKETLKDLEQHIHDWQLYLTAEILNDEEKRPQWQREHRLRLLAAIPEDTRDKLLADFIKSEAEALPGFDREQMSEPEVFMAKSPMSAEEMSAGSVEEIQAMFEELDDECEYHPTNWTLGGVVEASREFEKLVESDLPKALQVAESFRPERDETAVSYLVTGVARSQDRTLVELEDIIRTFVQRGFKSERFMSAIACAVDGKLEKKNLRLSSDIALLLETAVHNLSKEPVKVFERNGNDREESVLWGSSHGQMAAMEGLRPMVAALTQHYFATNPPETTKWLDLLNFGVGFRSDSLTWQSLALTDLWRLNQVDYQLARSFVKRLFELQPEVLTCHSGVFLIYFLMNILEPSYLAEIVTALRKSAWNLGEQAAGELAAVDFFVRKSPWSRQIIEEALTVGLDERLAAGVAYTTGRAWLTDSHRKEAVLIMQRLIGLNSERMSHALASKMRLPDTNIPDDETFGLIDLLCTRPALLRQGFAYIVQAVPDLMVWDPERIYNLLKVFTAEVGKDFLNHNTHMPYFAKPVVDATLTLQKIPGFETRALELFERQMALGMSEARTIIMEIDRLPKLAMQG